MATVCTQLSFPAIETFSMDLDSTSPELISDPSPVDVLCGKQGPAFGHSGNKRFRKIILENLPSYVSAPNKTAKSKVVKAVYAEFTKVNARFLRYDSKSGLWYAIEPHEGREKVSHAFRDRVRERSRSERRRRAAALKNKQLKEAAFQHQRNMQAPPFFLNNVFKNSLTDTDSERDTMPLPINFGMDNSTECGSANMFKEGKPINRSAGMSVFDSFVASFDKGTSTNSSFMPPQNPQIDLQFMNNNNNKFNDRMQQYNSNDEIDDYNDLMLSDIIDLDYKCTDLYDLNSEPNRTGKGFSPSDTGFILSVVQKACEL